MRTKLLTEQEQAGLVKFRDRILVRGLSTERCNRPAAEKAYNALLEDMGHAPVSNFSWVDSPSQMHTKLLWGQLWGQLKDQLWDQLRGQLKDQLWDQLRGQLDQWELQYCAWMEYAASLDEIVVDQDKLKTLKLLVELGEHTFWILPLKDGAIFCDRPISLHRNENHDLHSEDSKAIEFADGWGIYAINGVRFDDELGEKLVSGTITAKDLAEIEDVDQRKIAMTFLTGEDFVRETGAELVDCGESIFYEHLPDRRIKKFGDVNNKGVLVTNRLYKIAAGDLYEEDKYFLMYENPSTAEVHISFVTNFVAKVGEKADECMARKHNCKSWKEFRAGEGA